MTGMVLVKCRAIRVSCLESISAMVSDGLRLGSLACAMRANWPLRVFQLTGRLGILDHGLEPGGPRVVGSRMANVSKV